MAELTKRCNKKWLIFAESNEAGRHVRNIPFQVKHIFLEKWSNLIYIYFEGWHIKRLSRRQINLKYYLIVCPFQLHYQTASYTEPGKWQEENVKFARFVNSRNRCRAFCRSFYGATQIYMSYRSGVIMLWLK